jgi:hypothetical protein
MKICRNLFHLITPLAGLVLASAQADLAPGRILRVNIDSPAITTVQLRPGFVTSVRLPEPVSSVVLGDPGAFKAEHSEAEPQLVFFKPSTPNSSRTNALITTRTGREVSLTLISRGASDKSATVDYVLSYERQRSFLVAPSDPSFLIQEVKSVEATTLLPGQLQQLGTDEPRDKILIAQQGAVPHWQGEQLRLSIGESRHSGDSVEVGFSVLNSSSQAIELLPPQVELTDSGKQGRAKGIKAEPVPIKSFRLTSRRLEPGERSDGVVTFERPAFKAASERLLLQIAQAEQVDRPTLAQIPFVPELTGGGK